MEYGLIVTVLCLTIVFGLLVFLIFALYIMQFFTARKNKANETVVTEIPKVQSDNQVQDDKRIIAAITAAVQLMCSEQCIDKKAKFIVRSIKRI